MGSARISNTRSRQAGVSSTRSPSHVSAPRSPKNRWSWIVRVATDERGRRLCSNWAWPAGPPSRRSRSSPVTCLLAEHVGSRLHVCHLSTAGSVEIVRWAKSAASMSPPKSRPTTCSSPKSSCAATTRVFKVNPPLRREEDVPAVREGLADGTIDIVATDHAPHPSSPRPASGPRPPTAWSASRSALRVVQTRWSTPGCCLAGRRPACMSKPARAHRPARRPRHAAHGRAARIPHLLRPLAGAPSRPPTCTAAAELALPRAGAARRGALDPARGARRPSPTACCWTRPGVRA